MRVNPEACVCVARVCEVCLLRPGDGWGVGIPLNCDLAARGTPTLGQGACGSAASFNANFCPHKQHKGPLSCWDKSPQSGDQTRIKIQTFSLQIEPGDAFHWFIDVF